MYGRFRIYLYVCSAVNLLEDIRPFCRLVQNLNLTHSLTLTRLTMKRVVYLWVLGFMLISSSYSLQAQTPGLAEYKQGESLRKSGNCQGAIEQYNLAIQANGTQYRYYLSKGLCELKLKQYDPALASFSRVTQLKPDFGGAYIKMAQIYLYKKDYNAAISALNNAYNNEADVAKKLKYKNYVVKLLLKINKPQDAQNEVRAMKELAPNDPQVLAAEGDVYAALARWNESITSYENAVAVIEKAQQSIDITAKYYYGLALAYYNAGQKDKAEATADKFKTTKYYRRWVAMKNKSGAKYYVAIAMGYYKGAVYTKAIDYANKAVQAEPENPLGYRVLGLIQLKNGQAQQGIQSLLEAANKEKDPAQQSKIYASMIKIQFNEGDYQGALRTANQILAKSDKNAGVWGLKAQAEYLLGKHTDAINSAQKAVDFSPKDPKRTAGFYFTQGLAANKAGNYEKAVEAFTKAMAGPFALAAKIERDAISAR